MAHPHVQTVYHKEENMNCSDLTENEGIKLSYINQIRIGELAENLDIPPEKLVNDILLFMTSRKCQCTEDLLWVCRSRINEINEKLTTLKLYEKPEYLSELEKYLFLEKVLTAK